MEKEIIKFFVNNKNIDDEMFHKFCESMGYNPHEAETIVYNLLESFFNAGKYKSLNMDNVDNNELKKGIEIEFEHTNNIYIATKITLDHLSENKNYYTKLIQAKL